MFGGSTFGQEFQRPKDYHFICISTSVTFWAHHISENHFGTFWGIFFFLPPPLDTLPPFYQQISTSTGGWWGAYFTVIATGTRRVCLEKGKCKSGAFAPKKQCPSIQIKSFGCKINNNMGENVPAVGRGEGRGRTSAAVPSTRPSAGSWKVREAAGQDCTHWRFRAGDPPPRGGRPGGQSESTRGRKPLAVSSTPGKRSRAGT